MNCRSRREFFRRKVFPWLLVLAWMAIIYLFSDQPFSGRETEKIFGLFNIPVRKSGHLSEYAVLFILCFRACGATIKTGILSRFPLIASFLISVLFAFSDEWHQSFVPGRSATFSDVLVDTVGTLIGLSGWLIATKLMRSKKVN